jgi:hypothetical protein
MNVEIGTEAPIFLFWEYLFQILGILSLQCSNNDTIDFVALCTILSSTKIHREKTPVPERSTSNFVRRHLPIFTFKVFYLCQQEHTVPNKKIVTVAEQGTNITDNIFCCDTTTLSSL